MAIINLFINAHVVILPQTSNSVYCFFFVCSYIEYYISLKQIFKYSPKLTRYVRTNYFNAAIMVSTITNFRSIYPEINYLHGYKPLCLRPYFSRNEKSGTSCQGYCSVLLCIRNTLSVYPQFKEPIPQSYSFESSQNLDYDFRPYS